MRNSRLQALALLLCLACGLSGRLHAAPDLGESLDYTLRFRGLITGFTELDIARLTLSVEPTLETLEQRPVFATRLQLTTAPFKKAEMLYPVRLDYRSWLDQQTLQPLLATKFLVTGETRQELFWFDRAENLGHHYQTPEPKDEHPGAPPPSPLLQAPPLTQSDWSGLRENKQIPLQPTEILDYLGLLHRLRRLPLESGKWYDFTVFSGKKLEHYRVQAERERLVRLGWDLDTLMLRLYEYDPKKGELKDETQLWLSDDDQRRLLRVYAESTVGALEGILETGRPDDGHSDGLSEQTRRSLEAYLDF